MPLICKRQATLPARFLLMALTAVLLAAVAEPAMAADKSWGGFFGRTHVLWLHLPIGLLIGAFVIELLGFFRRSRGYDVAAMWLFILGALSCLPAVLSGMLLGTEQAAENAEAGKAPGSIFALLTADTIQQGVSETLGWHMWLGIALMVIAIVAAVLKVCAVRKQWKGDSEEKSSGGYPLMGARLALIATMLALPFAGHLGGNLVHTNTYLFERAPFDVPQWAIDWPEETTAPSERVAKGDVEPGTAAFWQVNIQPVMDKHCTACHNASKQNGKLRLDTLEWAMKGGSSAGSDNIKPEDIYLESEMYRRVALPHFHEEHMPTNKKKYGVMSQEDIDVLAQWLMEFDGDLTSGFEKEDDGSNDGSEEDKVDPEAKKAAKLKAGINAITKAGGSANSLSLSQPELSVKFAYMKELSPDAVFELDAVAEQVAWLTFEGSALDDDGVGELPNLPILTELNLKDTKITDEGVEWLPEMPKLEWLNLFGTDVSDKSIESLRRYTTLKKLYITGTKYTPEGVAKLRDALPGTQVFSDHDGAFSFPSDTPEGPKPESEKEAADKAAAAGKPVNDKCPVADTPIKAEHFVIFEGKKVAFCCGNCKAKFEKDPKKFAGKLPK